MIIVECIAAAFALIFLGLLSIKLHDMEKRIITQQHNIRELLRHARQGLPIACPECQSRWAPGDSRWQSQDEETSPVGAAAENTPASAADHHADWE